MSRSDIRLALPYHGRLEQPTLEFLSAAGLRVESPSSRRYVTTMPAVHQLTVIFQRLGDMAVAVRDGSVDLAITGLDVLEERCSSSDPLIILHEALGFAVVTLMLAVPEEWPVFSLTDLAVYAPGLRHPLRVATRHPRLTAAFLEKHGFTDFTVVRSEGALPSAPAVGYADIISDLVASGQTLRANRLRALEDGIILHSQAVLVANRTNLTQRPEVLAAARCLLEYIEAYQRGRGNCLIIANMRGSTPQTIAAAMREQPVLCGLRGPSVAPLVTGSDEAWYSVSLVVPRESLMDSIAALRAVGGSSVVVLPVTYIFEEEPERSRRLERLLEVKS